MTLFAFAIYLGLPLLAIASALYAIADARPWRRWVVAVIALLALIVWLMLDGVTVLRVWFWIATGGGPF